MRTKFSKGATIREAVGAPVLHTHTYGWRSLSQRLRNEGLGWRYAGATYTLVDMILDMISPVMWIRCVHAILSGELRESHEILFPFIRPLMVYKGLHYPTAYSWERETLNESRSRTRDLSNKDFS